MASQEAKHLDPDRHCILQGSHFANCVIGCNSFVGPSCRLTNCLLMGNDNYTNASNIEKALSKQKLIIGIGRLHFIQLTAAATCGAAAEASG